MGPELLWIFISSPTSIMGDKDVRAQRASITSIYPVRSKQNPEHNILDKVSEHLLTTASEGKLKRTKQKQAIHSSWTELEESIEAMPLGQRKIIQASIDEFAEKGYSASSTLAIAERAGVSEGLIFKYFKNKATLLRQAVFPILATALVPLAIRGAKNVAKAPHETARSFLGALVRERLEFARDRQKHLRILLQELPLNEELRSRMLKVLQAELFPVMRQKIHSFQEAGQLRAMPTEQLMSLLMPQIMGFVLGRTILGLEFSGDDDEDIEVLVDTMLNGIKAAPEKEKSTKQKKRTKL